MTKQEIYDTIVSLTAEIKNTNIAFALFEAAKSEKGRRKVEEVAETFKKQYAELYQRMCSFADGFNVAIEQSLTKCNGEIFGIDEDFVDNIHVFDSNAINPSSFFVLTFLTEIRSAYLFAGSIIMIKSDMYLTDDAIYVDALEKESGSLELAEFLGGGAFFSEEEIEMLSNLGFSVENKYELLANVFAGKLKEYLKKYGS